MSKKAKPGGKKPPEHGDKLLINLLFDRFGLSSVSHFSLLEVTYIYMYENLGHSEQVLHSFRFTVMALIERYQLWG